MKFEPEMLDKKANNIIFFLITLLTLFLISSMFLHRLHSNTDNVENNRNLSQPDNFDILDFWEKEIEHVNNSPLNINLGDNYSILYGNPFTSKQYVLNAQDIYFDSPNWINSNPETIRIHGYIFFPHEIKTRNPGCLVMHGLNADIKDIYDLIIPYFEKGFIVLAYSHPGHGISEGAKPSPENLYYEGEYNESAHFYLTLCAAIQGLRVLENLSSVNSSQILVTGESYGGLNAMWLSGICGERIAGVISYVAMGDIYKNINFPSKLIFWILGKSPTEITNSYLTNQLLRFDPIYYLKSPKVPPILWQIGTNDDFFHYSCIQGTFDAVNHSNKFLQIFPNEHHGYPSFENSTKFFIDFILNNGTRPPKIELFNMAHSYGVMGDSLNLTVEINSTLEISSVIIVYNRIEIIGSCWQKVYLTKTDDQKWEGVLTPGLFDSNIDFYIITNIKGLNGVWFSSNIFSGGKLTSNYSFIFIIILLTFISTPIILSIRNRLIWLTQFKISVLKKVRKHIYITLIITLLSEALAYLSLVLPWVIYEKGGVIFTHIYIFNNIFTWKLFFGEIASMLTSIFLFIMAIFSILSFIKPRITGVFKLIYPTIILILISFIPIISGALNPESLISNFGITYPGIGPYLMIISAVLMIIIGKWDSNLYQKLGLKKKGKKSFKIKINKIFKILPS